MMKQTGVAYLPLHGGKAPAWLFQRMVRLGREIARLIIEEHGPEELLIRISGPYWFQSLGCVLGFDWHSSGVTTTVCGALKEGLNFFFTLKGSWAVVQQGMSERFARRYHWYSENIQSLTLDPHAAICSNLQREKALNLVAHESAKAQELITDLSKKRPEKITQELKKLQTLSLPAHHEVSLKELHPESIEKILLKTYETKAQDFEGLLGKAGVGAKTLRALALISEITYGTPASWKDPAKFSFAHGGKDGHPYPVNREVYDQSIEILRKSLERARVEKENALKRLRKLFP